MQSKRFRTGKRGICALAAGFLTALAAPAAVGQVQIIYVDGDSAAGGNGTTWALAYNYLQDAMNASDLDPGDQIWVAAATNPYKVDQYDANTMGTADRRETFQIDINIELYGGFDGTENDIGDRDPANNVTILSGDIRKNILSPEEDCGDQGFDCPVEAGDISASCCQAVCAEDAGCCITDWDEICDALASTLECCGPAVHVVTFGANTTASAVIDGFKISDGFANRGPIESSSKDNDGGGMLVCGSPTVSRCRFTDNLAFDMGAGVATVGKDEFPTFANCVFHNNNVPFEAAAGNHGGGFASYQSNPTLTNCLFYDNQAEKEGGAIFLEAGGCGSATCGEVTLVNCTIVENIADSDANGGEEGGGIFANGTELTMDNCILYDNRSNTSQDEDAQIAFSLGSSDIDYCCIEGLDDITGTGNIGDDPDFVAAGSNNYRLDDTSPCIDTGNTDDTIIPDDLLDIDDNGEIFEPMPELDLLMRVGAGAGDCIVDMGAYEAEAVCIDLDDDGVVGTTDLIDLLGDWGNDPGGWPDYNCDGIVGTGDLIILLGAWGNCPGTAGAEPPSLQEAFEDACLDWPEDWNATKDALGTSEQDNYLCWLDHYLNHCSNCFCPHAGSTDCSGDDPFN